MSDRFERGLAILENLNGAAGKAVVERFSDFAPAFGEQLVSFIFGDIYARPQLDLRTRQIVTIAALTALGHALPQLEIHVRGGLRAGLTEDDIIEIMHQVAAYAGFPAALNALAIVRQICREPSPAGARPTASS